MIMDYITVIVSLVCTCIVVYHAAAAAKQLRKLKLEIQKSVQQQVFHHPQQQSVNVNVNVNVTQSAPPQISIITNNNAPPQIQLQITAPQKNILEPLQQNTHDQFSDKVEVLYDNDMVQIGNNKIGRQFDTTSKKLRTTRIINRRTDGQETTFAPAAGSEEFVIKFISKTQKPAPQQLNKTGWTVQASSWSTKEQNGNGAPQCLIDDNANTYWITNYGTGEGEKDYPHWAIIDMQSQQTFKSFSYTPLQNGPNYQAGNVIGYTLYCGNSLEELKTAKPTEQGYFYYDGQSVDPIYINLEKAVQCRYVKFEPSGGLGAYGRSRTTAGGAQLSFFKDPIADTGVYIKCSQLELERTRDSDITDGKALQFHFKPHQVNGVDWTVVLVTYMNDGEHFMRRHLELSVPEHQRNVQKIDYIELESLRLNEKDDFWAAPQMASGDEAVNGYHMACGQPVFVQGMFLGTEFSMHETLLHQKRIYTRYYSGKSLRQLQQENRLKNDSFVTWPAVFGAARALDLDVLSQDFYEYIKQIATPTKMRTQYNSWFDWMLDIDNQNIITSFYEIERGLTQSGAAPMDAYVVDDGWNAYGKWKDSNTTGFWQFNDKFPNGLAEPKQFTDRVSSAFGLWLGPRGGYVYMDQFAKFLEQHGNGELNPAANDVCVCHKRYLDKLLEFFLKQQYDYNINYWKIDGFVAIPCPRENNQHINGGVNSMYWFTELWERWGAMLIKMRREAESRGQNDLWINLTCYINPSPWLLQWANSLWIQVSEDMARKDVGMKRQVDQLLTYRDGRHHEFHKVRQFKFPNANIYNHDPIYGKTQTDLAGTMDDDEFRAYLFMIISRGTLLQNLYYSYNMIDEGQKWAVTADALDWKQQNFSILRNAQQFGGSPDAGEVYGYSAWAGANGIISIRNPKDTVQEFTLTLDRNIGVTEGISNISRISVLNFRSLQKDDNSLKFNYGQKIVKVIQPGEAVIWQFSDKVDQSKPVAITTKCSSNQIVSICFDRRVDITGAQITVNNMNVNKQVVLADLKTIQFECSKMTNNTQYHLKIVNLKDFNNGGSVDIDVDYIYYQNQVIATVDSTNDLNDSNQFTEVNDNTFNIKTIVFNKQVGIARKLNSVQGKGDFNLSFVLNTTSKDATVVEQQNEIQLFINHYGFLTLKLKNLETTSKKIVNDTQSHLISCCREKNGMLKIYIDGKLDCSVYIDNKNITSILRKQIQLGGSQFVGTIGKLLVSDRALTYKENADYYNSFKQQISFPQYF